MKETLFAEHSILPRSKCRVAQLDQFFTIYDNVRRKSREQQLTRLKELEAENIRAGKAVLAARDAAKQLLGTLRQEVGHEESSAETRKPRRVRQEGEEATEARRKRPRVE